MNKQEIIKKIETKVASIWNTKWKQPDIKVEIAPDGSYVDITISAMYDRPGCTFDQMTQLSHFFGTDKIGEAGDFEYEGCETCDYGSKYGFTLRIGKPTREVE